MNLLIIQARLGSTRLPGKVLKKINHQTILENLIERISKAKEVDRIIIATTTNKEDDEIAVFCETKKWNCYRGSDLDVLDRFYQAAQQFEGVENIIRITADCPLHHHQVIDFVVSEYKKSKADYFSNSNNEPAYLEDGFDVEVFTLNALEDAWKNAKLLSEREHVTPYIKNSGKYICFWKKFNKEYNYKLSVDSINDFNAVAEIFKQLESKHDFGLNDVVELLKQKPEILQLNKDSVINLGYKKSIEEDKTIN